MHPGDRDPSPLDAAHDDAADRYRRQRRAHWDRIARALPPGRRLGSAYHARIEEVYRSIVPRGARVLEVGCGIGDLLAAVEPAMGVGLDFSSQVLSVARQRHPHLHFVLADATQLPLDRAFDVVILSDLVNDLWDVQRVLEQVNAVIAPHGRLIVNVHRKLWEWPLRVAHRIGAATPILPQNWLALPDLSNLLALAGFQTIRGWQEILWPAPTPVLADFLNRVLCRFPPFRWGALADFLIARPQPRSRAAPARVSVIVPARNEAGNMDRLLSRVPNMGAGTEVIFVEGHSVDDTRGAIVAAMDRHRHVHSSLLRQEGVGKGDAVRLGFARAGGDILMILDADMTVAPEDLPRFYDAIHGGRGEFINGVRLVYPMERQAMRLVNFVGNRFFSAAFSWLLGQSVKDTLCGTKVLWREDYRRISRNRRRIGDFDPFGDFDLLFGAAKLGLKIVDLPIRYRERTYGSTNIQRWKHGALLFRMLGRGAAVLKFV